MKAYGKIKDSTGKRGDGEETTQTKSPSKITAEIKLYLCFRTSLKL